VLLLAARLPDPAALHLVALPAAAVHLHLFHAAPCWLLLVPLPLPSAQHPPAGHRRLPLPASLPCPATLAMLHCLMMAMVMAVGCWHQIQLPVPA
jgi:hypothetical protein